MDTAPLNLGIRYYGKVFGLLRMLPRVMFKHLLPFSHPLLTPRNQPHSSVTNKILTNNAASAICLATAFSALLSSWGLERSAGQFLASRPLLIGLRNGFA